MLTKFQTFVFLASISLNFCIAEKAGKGALNKYTDDKEWKCDSEKQVKLLQSSDGKKAIFPVCLYAVKCEKIAGAAADPVGLKVSCKLHGDNCADVDDCAKENQNYEKGEIVWTRVEQSTPVSKRENIEKFGENCEYVETKPSALWRKEIKAPEFADDTAPKSTSEKNPAATEVKVQPAKPVSDVMCASPVHNCAMMEPVKGSFLATCKYVLFEGQVACPPAQDCLAAAIPVKPALTVSGAKALASSSSRPVGSGANVTTMANAKPAHDSK